MKSPGEDIRRRDGDLLLRALSHAAGLAVTLIVPVLIEAANRGSPGSAEGPVMATLLALFVAPLAAAGFMAGTRLARQRPSPPRQGRRLAVSALTGAGSAVMLYGIVGAS